MNPDDLFGYDGIYVKGRTYAEWYEKNKENIQPTTWGYPSNFQMKGKEWERDALLEIFEEGKKTFEQDIGIRIRGGSTRFFEQKGFGIYARKKYGKDVLSYELFHENRGAKENVISEYDAFMLRNWGNNWRSYIFIDPLVQGLVQNRSVSTQYSQPCVAFLNGEYWGLYDMKEKYGTEYFKQHYKIEEENLIMIKAQATADRSGRAVEIGNESDIAEYEKLETFVNDNDLSVNENYNELCSMVDIDSFIDLYAIRMYVEAVDFPSNNWACWKTRTISDKLYQDGKWRWMLYDVDPDMGHTNYYDGLEISKQYSVMFSKLLQNDNFKEKFVTIACDLMNNNFKYENVENELTNMYNECGPYMYEYYDRFGPIEVESNDEDKSEYYLELYNNMLLFFKNQTKYIQEKLKEKGLVHGEAYTLKIVMEDSKGNISVNTSELNLENGKWEGEYFSDFSIKLKVYPQDGKIFKGWYNANGILLSNELEMQFKLEDNTVISAIFQ